jgi:hypothetical protein
MGGYVYAEHFRHGSALYRDFLMYYTSSPSSENIIHILTPLKGRGYSAKL